MPLDPADFYVGSTRGNTFDSSPPRTFTVAAHGSPADGDLMLVAAYIAESGTFTPHVDWDTVLDVAVGNDGTHRMAVWSKPFETGDTSWVFTYAYPGTPVLGPFVAWVLVAYRGVDAVIESDYTVDSTDPIATPTLSSTDEAIEVDFGGSHTRGVGGMSTSESGVTKLTDTYPIDAGSFKMYMSAFHRNYGPSSPYDIGNWIITAATIGVLLSVPSSSRGLLLGTLTLN